MIWFLVALLILFILIYFSTVRIKIEYKRKKENDMIHIEVKIWFGLITLRYQIPMLQVRSLFDGVKVERKVDPMAGNTKPVGRKKFWLTPSIIQRYFQKIRLLRIRVHDLNEIAKKTMKYFICENLQWNTRVGVGDAAATGVVTGLVWGIKTTFLGMVFHFITLKTIPQINVVPAFRSETVDTHFHCILRFKIGHAIIAGTRIMLNLRKGREGRWQSTLFRA